MAKAMWNGALIAESNETQSLEGNTYFPLKSVNPEYLSDSETTSVCPWKGTANYYSLRVGEQVNKDAAWIYRQPKPEAKQIANHVAFWRGVEVQG